MFGLSTALTSDIFLLHLPVLALKCSKLLGSKGFKIIVHNHIPLPETELEGVL